MQTCFQCKDSVDMTKEDHHTLVIDGVVYTIHDMCVASILTQYVIELNHFESHIDSLSKREEVIGNA